MPQAEPEGASTAAPPMPGNRLLVLKTRTSDDYFYQSREVNYPRLVASDALDEFMGNLPVAGLGVYVDSDREGAGAVSSSQPPAYLRITGLRRDETGKSHIRFEFLGKMTETSSAELDRELATGRWIEAVTRDAWVKAQQSLQVKPPREWEHIFEATSARPACVAFLGPRLLRLLDAGTDYETCKTTVAEVLTALGFDISPLKLVDQGETAPNGFACTPVGERFGYWFIYDCRSKPFRLRPEDGFRIKSHIRKAWREFPALKAVPADAARFLLLAPDYDRPNETEQFANEIEQQTGAKVGLLTFEALLYVLTRKLALGYRFTVADVDRLFGSGRVVDGDGAARVLGAAVLT